MIERETLLAAAHDIEGEINAVGMDIAEFFDLLVLFTDALSGELRPHHPARGPLLAMCARCRECADELTARVR